MLMIIITSNDFMSTNIKQKDIEDGRLKCLNLIGSCSFLYLTRIKDPKANVSMKLEIDPNRTSKTQNFTIQLIIH